MSMTPLERMLDISTIYHEPDVGFHRRVRYAFEDLSPGRDEVRRERRRQSRAQPQRNPDPKAGCSMSVNVDELGPVDWIVVEFPGTEMTGEIAPLLEEYVEKGLVKILDLLFLTKADDGQVEAFEASDFEDSPLGRLRTTEAELAMVLSEQDVLDLAETIEPGSSAAVLVWENLWAAPLGAAVRHAGGQLVASGRIPVQALLAAAEADAEVAEKEKEGV